MFVVSANIVRHWGEEVAIKKTVITPSISIIKLMGKVQLQSINKARPNMIIAMQTLLRPFRNK